MAQFAMTRYLELNEISFPDEAVIEMTLDRDVRRLKLEMSGAWNGKQVGPGCLIIHDWDDLVRRRYNSSALAWNDIASEEDDDLKDVCDLKITPGKIIIRGFGATSGQWIELVAYNAQGRYVLE